MSGASSELVWAEAGMGMAIPAHNAKAVTGIFDRKERFMAGACSQSTPLTRADPLIGRRAIRFMM
jgi:hypothetical protein